MRRDHHRAVSRQTVGNWFGGRSKNPPRQGDLDALCAILEVTPDQILYGRRDAPAPAHVPTIEEQVGERLWWTSVEEGQTIGNTFGVIGAAALAWLDSQLRRELQRTREQDERNFAWVMLADAVTDVERTLDPTHATPHPKLRRALEQAQALIWTADPEEFPLLSVIGVAQRAPARERQPTMRTTSGRTRTR
jgi:transcriptional regulator with XRE-family HTH domain